MDKVPDDIDKAIIEARNQLIELGLVQMVGRTVSGEAVYALSGRPSRRIPLRRWSRGILPFPAFLLEHVIRYSACGLASLFDEPPPLALTLVTNADRLRKWRDRWTYVPRSVWLSIKPD